jgi:broad specificity phosphatase PhoE
VRVDYGSAVGRANAPMVRTVVLGTGFGRIAEDANARLAAKRFHAAITFLNRARENRKGNWDDRYTADAVNDYIRQGFGKPRIRVGLN